MSRLNVDAIHTEGSSAGSNLEFTASSRNVTAKGDLQVDGNVTVTGTLPADKLTGTAAAINGSNITNLPAANLTGTLPAISGANLTNLPGGGKIIKVWESGYGNGEGIGGNTNSTTYAKKGYIDITPTSASNKILVIAKYNMHFRNHQNNESNQSFLSKLMRTSAWDDTTSPVDGEVIQGGVWIGNSINGAEYQLGMATHFWLDSPATTDNRRYGFYCKVNDADWTVYFNYNTTNHNMLALEIADVAHGTP